MQPERKRHNFTSLDGAIAAAPIYLCRVAYVQNALRALAAVILRLSLEQRRRPGDGAAHRKARLQVKEIHGVPFLTTATRKPRFLKAHWRTLVELDRGRAADRCLRDA